MKLTLKELNRIKFSLAKLLVSDGVPGKVARRAKDFAKQADIKISALEEIRTDLLKKYSVLSEDGNYLPLNAEQGKAFNAEFDEVLADEVELPDIHIEETELENAKLSMLDYANLSFVTERK